MFNHQNNMPWVSVSYTSHKAARREREADGHDSADELLKTVIL